MRYFCTYFDRNYLVKGLALIESLRLAHGDSFKIIVVCMDELTRVLLTRLNISNVSPIPMHEIEFGDEKLLATQSNRGVAEYLWTCTPTIILRLLERNRDIDILTYVDADLFFYSSSEKIFTELGNKSVFIHAHRFPPDKKTQEKYGIFNVGLLCFRNDTLGHEVLNWWRDRCIEWCYERTEDGKFGDQGYLNDWPQRFPCVVASENIGVGVAPWNDDQYKFELNNINQVCVSGVPVVFYHYHSFVLINPFILVPAADPSYCPSIDIVNYCVLPYAYVLNGAIAAVQAVHPDFQFGIMRSDFSLSNNNGFLARRELKDEIAKLSPPHTIIEIDKHWLWYEPVR